MSRHVVVGKGPIGRSLAHLLAEEGHDVEVLSRSGAPSAAPGSARKGSTRSAISAPGTIRHRAVDAADATALAEAARGAAVLYNCVNPAYHRWPVDWPPVADALLTAAERSGAVLVTAGNLYGYGAGTQRMTEESPLRTTETKGRVRVAMWQEAERRHRAGVVRATEVRGSDYLGPEAEEHAHAGPRLLRPLLAGRTLSPVGAADVPHSWTYLPDFARALLAAGVSEAAWGRAWHVPSPEPLTFRELASTFAEAAGAPAPRIRPVPMGVVSAVGLVQPMMRELARMGYQFTQPFVLESEVSQRVLGVAPTPWPTIVSETLAAWDGSVAADDPRAVTAG